MNLGMDVAASAEPTWRIGETLPWVIAWTGEAHFSAQASTVFKGLREVVQPHAPGEGVPMLRHMHLRRQRLGVMEFRCHVCGEPTPSDDRHLFPVATGALLKVRGRTRYVSHLPPTHAACAETAQRLCPHLRATYARPVSFPREAGTVGPETSVPEGLEAIAERLGQGRPLGFSYYRVYGDAFTRLVLRLRREAAGSSPLNET